MTVLAVKGLTKQLGGRDVLRDIQLLAQSGEFVCILGPNGAGKSTLLRALAGLSRDPQILLDDRPVAALSPRQRARHIAWLPQTGQAIWPLPVRALVALGRIPHGVTLDSLTPADEIAIAQALADCGLTDLAARDITTLSGGERARAWLARALAVQAPILLADEPVSALDPQHQLTVMEVLRVQARQGRLVVAVLHDLSLATRFADRILLLKEGRVAADGAPHTVLNADILRTVFGVEVLTFENEGLPIVLPFSVAHR